MFLSDEQIERNTLRQSDVIAQVHLLGAINISSIHYSSPASNLGQYSGWSVPTSPEFGDAMVLSHSCEIALENKVKVTSIILAPLRDIHKATAQDRIDDLISSNLIDRSNPQASFLKYFYISPNPKLKYSSGAVVDFSKCFSVRKQAYDVLLSNKIAQLSKDAAASMALKLALYFHRNGFFERV